MECQICGRTKKVLIKCKKCGRNVCLDCMNVEKGLCYDCFALYHYKVSKKVYTEQERKIKLIA